MSLLTDEMERCTIVDAATQPDGHGGVTTIWTDGAQIQAAIIKNTTLQAQVAEKENAIGVYTIVTGANVVLKPQNVLRRESDGKIFRVTSDATDNSPPQKSTLQYRKVSAEEWALPAD